METTFKPDMIFLNLHLKVHFILQKIWHFKMFTKDRLYAIIDFKIFHIYLAILLAFPPLLFHMGRDFSIDWIFIEGQSYDRAVVQRTEEPTEKDNPDGRRRADCCVEGMEPIQQKRFTTALDAMMMLTYVDMLFEQLSIEN